MPENSHPGFVHFSFLSLVFHSWGQRERRFKAETSFSHMVKNPSANAGNKKRCRLDPWVRKIPWSRKWQPTPIFLPGESHGQRSLVGYIPWGHKELDMIEVTYHSLTCGGVNIPNQCSGLTVFSLEKAMAPHSSTLAWKIPWTEDLVPGEGNGNPLQCSCLENPRDGGAWWAAVYGVMQSQTRLYTCIVAVIIWNRISSILSIKNKKYKTVFNLCLFLLLHTTYSVYSFSYTLTHFSLCSLSFQPLSFSFYLKNFF